jgi:hypothetical protein
MCFKKLCILSLLSISAAFAADYLIRIDLADQRLDPLFDDNLAPIAELDNSALLIATDEELDKLIPYSFSIIDRDPEQGRYYLVHKINKRLDLTKFGEILMIDGTVYLLKIKPDMLEELIKEKVDIQRLMFSPIIRSGQRSSSFYYDPLVQTIVDHVDPDSVLAVVQRLQDFVTRYSTHDSCTAAANYIASKFADYGCDSVYFQNHTSGHAPNVIGVKMGTLYPDSIYTVVCGHFDATSYLSPNIAPGADDNASGTASVIEAIRVMRSYQFEYSIRYIAFSGEEFGLYGSYYYASQARSQGDSILGVLNADMIAYVNAYPESLDVLAKISNPPCEPFADFFIAAADSYTTLLTRKRMVTSAAYSDHHPFWENGYLALCNIEDNPPVNPYYHEPGDTIGAGYNDNAFCTEVVKAQVAALSIMARPQATAYLTMPDYWIVDSAPGGNGNGLWENGEEVDLVIQIYNMGVDTARNASGTIDNTSPYVTLIEDSCYAGNVLPHDTVEISFRMSAAASVPPGYETDFDLNVACDAGSWDYALQVYINPLPAISFFDYSIMDANGLLEPGETVDLEITLTNVGAAPAENVTATITTADLYLTILTDTASYGSILPDSAVSCLTPYVVEADSLTPVPHVAQVVMSIAGTGYVAVDTFGVLIGNIGFYDTVEDTLVTNQYTVQGHWHRTQHRSHSPDYAWWNGNEGSWVYSNNVDASIITPSITLGDNSEFECWNWYYLESNYDYGYIELSTDNGASWSQLTSFNGTSGNWVRYSTVLNYPVGTQVKLRFRLDTDYSVVYEGWYVDDIRVFDPLGVTEVTGLVATEVSEFFSISPNPFKRVSAISYQLARASRVALSVYDVSGRLVKALSAGQELIEPGYYTVSWDGSDEQGRAVPAGVYFVKFESADHTNVQKAILLR